MHKTTRRSMPEDQHLGVYCRKILNTHVYLRFILFETLYDFESDKSIIITNRTNVESDSTALSVVPGPVSSTNRHDIVHFVRLVFLSSCFLVAGFELWKLEILRKINFDQPAATPNNNVDSGKLNYLRTKDVSVIRPTCSSYYYLERLNKTAKTRHIIVQESNPMPPEYKAGILSTIHCKVEMNCGVYGWDTANVICSNCYLT